MPETSENPTSQAQPAAALSPQQIQEAAKLLQETCVTVDFEVSWFATRRTASKAEVQSMIKDEYDEAETSMLSVGLKLLDSGDPRIQKMSKAKQALYAFRDSRTIPAAQIPLTAAISGGASQAQAGEDVKQHLQKIAGERVILLSEVDDFETYVQKSLLPNLTAAVAEANLHIEEIRENSRKKLKKRFDPKLFPEEFKIGIRGPRYRSIGVGIGFEQACPIAAARMKEVAQQQLADTVQLAVGDFANTFMEIVEIAAEQLSFKTELRPGKDHPLARMAGGVLKSVQFHKDDASIPEGSRVIEVEYREAPESPKKITELVGPLTNEEYAALKPQSSEQKGKVYESTFETLLRELERFESIRKMLGDAGQPLAAVVEQVSDLLGAAKSSQVAQVTGDIKGSKVFREKTGKALAKIADAVEGIIDNLPVVKRKRRRAITVKTQKE
jgi:hypothetical protein